MSDDGNSIKWRKLREEIAQYKILNSGILDRIALILTLRT